MVNGELMKKNLRTTRVKDISYLINSACLRAHIDQSLESLAEMLCRSNLYKVYLEDNNGNLKGTIQAKKIAVEMLKLSIGKTEVTDMLPTVSYVLNFHQAADLADPVVAVQPTDTLQKVIELMELNFIREVAVVDEQGRLLGTLEAKHVLSFYLSEKAERFI